VKLDILVSGEPVDALSLVLHRDTAAVKGRALAAKMKELIPRQLFRSPHPGGHRRENHCARNRKGHGQERDRKVLWWRHHAQAQAARETKEGKKRMKKVGRVEIPQEAFLAVLKVNE
jgi:GTP-binding protein LepA